MNCYTHQKASKPIIKDSKITYFMNTSTVSRRYNFTLQLASQHTYDCLYVELTSHSHEIKYGIGDTEFKSDMPVHLQKFTGQVHLIDSFSMPRFSSHHSAKQQCYNPQDVSYYNWMVDILNGGHGKYLSRVNPDTKSTLFLRKKIVLGLSYSQTTPTPSILQHEFLKVHSGNFYIPYLMLEQLPPRPSEITYGDMVAMKQKQYFTVQFDIVDNWRMSSMQDRFIAYMDYICGEVVPPLNKILNAENTGFFQSIVFWLAIISAFLQFTANVTGRFQ